MKVDFSNTSKVDYERKLKSDVKSKYKSEESSVKKGNGDILEISEESRKLQPILQRLQSGYYNQTEVIAEVATRVDQEI